MKRIVIVDNQVPFVYGGAEHHINNLKKVLVEYGYEVDVVRIPFKWYPLENLLKHMLLNRLFDLTEASGKSIDKLIAFRFPSFYISHPNKVVWLMSTYKSAYEFWDTPYCDIPHTQEGKALRETIHRCDSIFIKEAKKLFANSKHVSSWFEEYTGIKSTLLYHPPPDQERLHCDAYENFIFFPSRLTPYKRHELAIRAMKYVGADVKLIMTGIEDNPEFKTYLQNLTQKLGLENKVIFLGGVSREKVIELYARCLGVLFPTFLEDYGYVTLEAMLSQKAVITCRDSGGPTEFVVDNITGFVREPDPEDIAEAIELLYSDKNRAIKMGKSGYERVVSLDISWENVVNNLLL